MPTYSQVECARLLFNSDTLWQAGGTAALESWVSSVVSLLCGVFLG